jgi:hypothetical protein
MIIVFTPNNETNQINVPRVSISNRGSMEFRNSIRQAAKKKIMYTNHALDEMNSEEKVITTEEIRGVILNGEMIEDYLDDKRGHSCLLFGISGGR